MEGKSLLRGQVPEGDAPCPPSCGKKAIIGLTCQFRVFVQQHWRTKFCSFASFWRVLLTSLVPDIFGISGHFLPSRAHWGGELKFADFMLFSSPAIADSKILLNFKKIYLVILKIFKNLNSMQDLVAIEHYPGSRKSLNFPSCVNSSPLPLAFIHKGTLPLRQFPPWKLLSFPEIWPKNNSITKEICITIDPPPRKNSQKKARVLWITKWVKKDED